MAPIERPRILRIDTSNSTSPASSSTVSPTRSQANSLKRRRNTHAQQYLNSYRVGGLSSKGNDETTGKLPAQSSTPINVPTPPESSVDPFANENSLPCGSTSSGLTPLEEAFRSRNTSISFSSDMRSDSGTRHVLEASLPRQERRPRGKSMLHELEKSLRKRAPRAHSESERSSYDPVTGQSLNRQAERRDARRHFHTGESSYPFLQDTVDDLARHEETPESLHRSNTVSQASAPTHTFTREAQDTSMLSPLSITSPRFPTSYGTTRAWPERPNPGRRVSHASVPNQPRPRRALSRQSSTSMSPASAFLHQFGPITPDLEDEEEQVGEYVLGKVIGRGGFSVVREARATQNGKEILHAVKIVRKRLPGRAEADNERVQAEFEQEVALWRSLHHRHVLPLIAVYHTPFATYCVMQFHSHGTLFDLVRKNKSGLSGEVAQRYSYQLASAIKYLHEDMRIVHRDIKLENCLIDKSGANAMKTGGDVILCDFGMAVGLDAESIGMREEEEIIGHPSSRNIGPSDTSVSVAGSITYAAPEMIDAQAGAYNTASDIWAFGVVVYTLLVGQLPFKDQFEPRLVMKIIAGQWSEDNLRSAPSVIGTEEEAVELVRGCLEMDQDVRWDIRNVLTCAWLEDCDFRYGEGVF